MTRPHGTAPHGVRAGRPPGLPPAYRLAEETGPRFLAAEIEAYRAPSAVIRTGQPHGALAHGTRSREPIILEDYITLRVSDVGYATRETDPGGVRAFDPTLVQGVTVDRAMDLAPNGQGAAAGWGELRIVSEAGALDTLIAGSNADGRPVRIRIGRKQPLPHGIWRDPAWAETAEFLVGLGAGWTLDDRTLRVALRDPSWWIDRPADGPTYTGAGGLAGTATLAGQRKPRLRGGTAGDPVRQIPPVLLDSANAIYQVSDARGGIVALSERGLSGGITSAGAVADITAASPAAGTYVVESSERGLFFRLGTFPPAGQLTLDAYGEFPSGAAPTTAAGVALELLREDFALPASVLDADSFTGLAAARNYPAGVWFGAGEAGAGVEAVGLLLRSALARLVPRRSGRLAAIEIKAFPAGTTPTATYTAAEIVECIQRELPAPMAPPPYRIRVAWGRNYLTQASDLNGTLSGARVQELAQEWRVASASSAAISAAWRRPSDSDLVQTALTGSAGAQALADDLAALWCVPAGRKLYDVTVPLSYALRHDLGEPIVIAYPGPLSAGALGRIVGERLSTGDNLATWQVLV